MLDNDIPSPEEQAQTLQRLDNFFAQQTLNKLSTIFSVDEDVEYVLELERKLEVAAELREAAYLDIEVDSTQTGNVHRVWRDTKLLGCFYRSPLSGLWIVEWSYSRDIHRYESSNKAIAAIVRAANQQIVSND
jgi:hypothetical protein